MNKYSVEIGDRHGSREVVGFCLVSGKTHIQVRCDCGEISIVRVRAFVKNQALRCRKCRAKVHSEGLDWSNPGITGMRSRLAIYKNQAKSRGLLWCLSEEMFKQLISQSCFYCGVAPHLTSISSCNETSSKRLGYGAYTYNGLDRKNNILGYTEDNTVSACKDCNVAKGTKTFFEFREWVLRLSEKLK